MEANVQTVYMQFNDASLTKIDIFRELDMNAQSITALNDILFNEANQSILSDSLGLQSLQLVVNQLFLELLAHQDYLLQILM